MLLTNIILSNFFTVEVSSPNWQNGHFLQLGNFDISDPKHPGRFSQYRYIARFYEILKFLTPKIFVFYQKINF